MTKRYFVNGEHWISKTELAENVEITNSEIIFKHSDGSSTHYMKEKVYEVIEVKSVYDKEQNYSYDKVVKTVHKQ